MQSQCRMLPLCQNGRVFVRFLGLFARRAAQALGTHANLSSEDEGTSKEARNREPHVQVKISKGSAISCRDRGMRSLTLPWRQLFWTRAAPQGAGHGHVGQFLARLDCSQ